MKKPSPPDPVLLFVGALYRREDIFLEARERLRTMLGDSLLESLPLPWEHSGYYEGELGSPLLRRFVFFTNRIDPEKLPDIKLATIRVEEELSSGGKRNINIDPGYLTLHNVVLASTKNYSHRIYIGKGIFAEVTLLYRDKDRRYQPHLFTYRDYASDEYAEIFTRARAFLRQPWRTA